MWKLRVLPLIVCAVAAACSAPAATIAPSAAPTTPESASSRPLGSQQPTPVTTEPSPSESAAQEPPAALAWAALDATGPVAREDHTWTVDPGAEVAYLFGGRDGATAFDDLWAYDLASDAWSELDNAGPAARFGHEAVWVDGTGLVIFAGQADGTTFFNDLWAFDADAGSWRELPSTGSVPVARYGTCAAIGPDGRLWISHGFTSDGTRFADTLAYDFVSGVWADETPEAPVPVNRCLQGCWWTDTGELALFGGQTTGVTALGDLWLLADGAWTMVEGELPADRNLYARARLSGGTLVFGGQAVDSSYLADAFVLQDGQTGALAIEPAGERPPPRAGAEMIVDSARERVLLFGGRDAGQAFADVWELQGIPFDG